MLARKEEKKHNYNNQIEFYGAELNNVQPVKYNELTMTQER